MKRRKQEIDNALFSERERTNRLNQQTQQSPKLQCQSNEEVFYGQKEYVSTTRRIVAHFKLYFFISPIYLRNLRTVINNNNEKSIDIDLQSANGAAGK